MTMLNVDYGNNISEETRARIVNLLEGEGAVLHTGISGEIIHEMMNLPGKKVLNVVTGKTIDEASRCLPDNQDELISEAAVLIKTNADYQFLAVELATLIRYFDAYPMDPKVTWKYTFDSNQEEPVNIIIFKILKNTIQNETH